jgi:hypothetical protein
MHSDSNIWRSVFRVDSAVSLGMAVVTFLSGAFEGIPWTYRIPAILATAALTLWLWRSLSLRRFLLPNRVLSYYENDVLHLHELFGGRSMIRDVTFKNVEIKGPGSIAFEGNCRFNSEIYNPNIDVLIIPTVSGVFLSPHFQFRDCMFDSVMFTNCGILAPPHMMDFLRQRFGAPPSPAPLEQTAEPTDPTISETGTQSRQGTEEETQQ